MRLGRESHLAEHGRLERGPLGQLDWSGSHLVTSAGYERTPVNRRSLEHAEQAEQAEHAAIKPRAAAQARLLNGVGDQLGAATARGRCLRAARGDENRVARDSDG